MEDQVGRLRHDRGVVAAGRGEHRLDRLLAELLRDLGATPRGQLGDIGVGGVGGAACADRRLEAVEGVFGHEKRLAQTGAKVNPSNAWQTLRASRGGPATRRLRPSRTVRRRTVRGRCESSARRYARGARAGRARRAAGGGGGNACRPCSRKNLNFRSTPYI